MGVKADEKWNLRLYLQTECLLNLMLVHWAVHNDYDMTQNVEYWAATLTLTLCSYLDLLNSMVLGSPGHCSLVKQTICFPFLMNHTEYLSLRQTNKLNSSPTFFACVLMLCIIHKDVQVHHNVGCTAISVTSGSLWNREKSETSQRWKQISCLSSISAFHYTLHVSDKVLTLKSVTITNYVCTTVY